MLSSPSIGKTKNNSITFVCFLKILKFIEEFGLFNSSIKSFTELNDLKKSFFGWSSSNDVDNSYVLYGNSHLIYFLPFVSSNCLSCQSIEMVNQYYFLYNILI